MLCEAERREQTGDPRAGNGGAGRDPDGSSVGGQVWMETEERLRKEAVETVIIITAFKTFCFEGEQRNERGI